MKDCEFGSSGDFGVEKLARLEVSLQAFFENERKDMYDLTYEEKIDLYAQVTDVFDEKSYMRTDYGYLCRLLLTSFLAAAAIIAMVPLAQWMSPPVPIESDPTNTFTWVPEPPVVIEQPKEEVKVEEPEKVEDIPEPRPTIEDLTYMQLGAGPGIQNNINISKYINNDIVGADDILNLIDLDEPPVPIRQVKPAISRDISRTAGEVRVLVEVIVDEYGKVRDPKILSSSDNRYNRPVIYAIRQWKFEPGMKLDRVVKTRLRVPFVFSE